MIQKFKRKITFLLMGVFAVFIIGILVAVNLYNYYSNWKEVQKRLDLQTQVHHMGDRPSDFSPDKRMEIESAMDEADDLRAAQIYSIKLMPDRTVIPIVLDEGSKYTEGELGVIAEKILQQNKESGFCDSFQYLIADNGGASLLSFMDVSGVRKQQHQMIFYSVVIGIFSIILLFQVSVVLSRWLVRPLQEAFDKQKQFIASASHELKTPLAVIKTSLDTMKNEGQGGKYLDYALEENARMSALVHEMLTLSNLEQTGLDIKCERIDMGKAVEGGCLPFEVMAYEKGVVLELELDSEIHVCANIEKIQQMVGILMDNAIRHTEQSGKVVVCLKNENGKACLQVKNEGEPIPESEQEKIFESFYRLDKSRNRQEGRYGLGLSIAQEIAESFGSRIQVKCEKGNTIFFAIFEIIK